MTDPWDGVTLPADVAEEPDFTEPLQEEAEAEEAEAEVDAVRLYFQQIASVPLLNARDEVRLCQQIEAQQHMLAAMLLAVPAAAQRIAQLIAAVRSGAMPVEGLLESPEGRPLREGEVTAALTALALERLRRRRNHLGRPEAAA